MDSFWVYVIVFIIWLVISGMRAANKAKKKNQGRNVPSAPKKTKGDISTQREIFKQLGLEDIYKEIHGEEPNVQTKEPVKPPPPAYEPPQREPEVHFLDTELEQARKSHYSEKSLVEEFKRVHEQGKQLEHHTHIQTSKEQEAAYAVDETKPYDAEELHLYDESNEPLIDDSAYDKTYVNRNRQELLKIIRNKKSVRNAFIVKEIFDRPDF